MSFVTSDDMARTWARRLEEGEARRNGLSVAAARKRVAGRLGVSPGTLENLARERLKGVRQWLFEKLHHAMMNELAREIVAHEHELAALVRNPGRVAVGQMEEVETVLARLRAIIRATSDDNPAAGNGPAR